MDIKPVRKNVVFQKAWWGFLTICRWLIFLTALGAGGFYAYKWRFPPHPFEIGEQKPSQLLGPIMSGNLPFLLGDLRAETTIPPLNLEPIEKAINLKSVKESPSQAAWKIAGKLCAEIREVDAERKTAVECLSQTKPWWKSGVTAILWDQLETRETALRKVHYTEDPKKGWEEFASQHREAIKKSYLQLLTAEKPVAASADSDHLICPLCKGEGRVMIRRTASGTINDVGSSCPLCIGTGMRKLKLLKNAKICPDCSGFGRRLLLDAPEKGKKNGEGSHETSSVATVSIGDGVFGQIPRITSCSRCLSRGYTLQPGVVAAPKSPVVQ